MDQNPLLLGNTVVPRRPFVKVTAGIVSVFGAMGCGLIWWHQVGGRGEDSNVVMPNVRPPIQLNEMTHPDYVKIFGQHGPQIDHIVRDRNASISLSAFHGQADVDDDINSHAVSQGRLGDCYFDASLAAIAHKHPQLIEQMFVHADVGKGEFKTRWFVSGRYEIVSVNAKIPTVNGLPAFLWTSSELTLWPAILEKSYAKLFQNYKAIESGSPFEAFHYLLGVPVETIMDQSGGRWSNIYGARSLDDVWNKIVAAVDNDYPIGIGSRGGFHGITGGHAYTLYGYSNNCQGRGKCVRVRNPWGTNHYSGVLSGQSQTIGDFWITWEEFYRNFHTLDIAIVRKGYRVPGQWNVGISNGVAKGYATLTMSQAADFTVQAVLPPSRMVKAAHCPALRLSNYRLKVYPRSQPSQYRYGQMFSNIISVDAHGAGEWIVEIYVAGYFGNLPSITLSAYMPESGKLGYFHPGQAALGSETNIDVETEQLPLELSQAASTPSELFSCLNYHQRLSRLGGPVLPRDAVFPESLTSIADPGVNCGDTAHGYSQSCSIFNHWISMVELADRMVDDLSCFSLTPRGAQCQVQNTKCNRNALFFCSIVGCNAKGAVNLNYYYTFEAACCSCNDPSKFR